MVNRYLFKALSLMQFLIFLIFFIAGVYLFAMSRSPRAAEFGDVTAVERHAAMSLIVSLFFIGPLIGIWRRERWAWWTGLVVNVICLVVSYWAMVYNQTDVGFVAMLFPVAFFVTVVLHLLSRPETWKSVERGDSVLFKKTV